MFHFTGESVAARETIGTSGLPREPSQAHIEISKTSRLSMSISVIEQAKIQAQVLVPLVKALQAELGEARANALVRKALGDLYRRFGEAFWTAKNEPNLGQAVASAFKTYARDDALAYDVIEQTQDAFAFDVKRCAYAELSRISVSPWSAPPILRPPKGSAPTSGSRARRPSCKAPIIATSAIGASRTGQREGKVNNAAGSFVMSAFDGAGREPGDEIAAHREREDQHRRHD